MKQDKSSTQFSRLLSRKGKRVPDAKSAFSLSRTALAIMLLAMLGLGLALSSSKVPPASASLQTKNGEAQISDSAALQIQALLNEKEARTPAQKKMDSQLVYATKMNRGVAIANGIERLETRVDY